MDGATAATAESAFHWGSFLPGFLLGLLSTLVVEWFKGRLAGQDESVAKRVDEIVATTWELARAANEYWQLPDGPKSQVLEPQIVGLEHFVLGSIERLHDDCPRFEIRADDTINLSDAVTGGDFNVRGRPPDVAQCVRAYTAASRLVQAVRARHRSTLRWFPKTEE